MGIPDFNLNTIYLVCAIAGGTVVILRLILMIIGFDHGSDVDMASGVPDLDGDGLADANSGDVGGVGFNLFSIQSISGFFTMFGLVGMGLLKINASDLWSLAGALLAGGITAWATAMIFLNMGRLQSEGTLSIANAVGKQGTVYLTVPETGTGVVSVAVQGSLRSLDALSGNGQKIPTGTIVKVTGISAGNIVVTPVLPPASEQPGQIH